MTLSIKEINENIVKAGRLDHSVIGVYSQSTMPEDALTVASVMKGEHPCVARALFLMSKDDDIPAIYVDGAGSNDCCSGAKSWFGYKEFPPNIENMFSSDSPSRESMRIKGSAALCGHTFKDMGKMVPLGKYIIMQKLSEIKANPADIASILCFGNAGQIRDLGAMIHHGESRAYAPIMAPWGSGCATFVSYPSGMAETAPKDTAFLGPMTPEAEGWLPADMLALGIPMNVAVRMAEGYGCSFAARR